MFSIYNGPSFIRSIASQATRLTVFAVLIACGFASPASAGDLRLLFLGDKGHHKPAERFAQLQPVLAKRGIELTYTENVGDLNKATLAKYAGLVIYANIDAIAPEQESALLEYVADGGGLVPLHCASFCFRNSPKYVELVGAQFKRHGTGTFRTEIVAAEHPIMQGFGGFESWDETYVHDKHNEANRTVLEVRADAGGREPWTWTRTQGKGRVFYTAWGHDERTWAHPGFVNLVERGIRWACGDDPSKVPAYREEPSLASYQPKMTPKRTDVKPFEYVDAHVPFYPPGGARKGDGEWNKMQLPLEPEESLKHYVTPDDFELRLFASEPNIGKSLAMTWDERGRLWLCESVDYPNELAAENHGRDRIRICEDTDGDGRADKFTVFAEGLSIPTTLTFYRGGVIVQNGTETLYLKDTDGDDKADTRRVLLTGWALGDTHGGVSNFRYGLDNWIWGMQGYNNSTPKAPAFKDKPAREFGTFRMGFFRFRLSRSDDPVVEEVEFIRSTNNNTWGLGFSEEGHVFGSTANGTPSVYMPIANRYYEAVRGWSAETLESIAESNSIYPITEKVRQVDHHDGFTAAAGHALYTARNYPPAYWNRTAFVCEPTGHLVATFVIEPNGAGFKSRNAWNLVASDDEWAAPIMAEVGPDGNVWVLDWYNYIVQHNPTPAGFTTGKGNAYETDLRDKRHCRVFRVVPKGWKETKSLDLHNKSASELVGAWSNKNMFWRLHAQRLLADRDVEEFQDAEVQNKLNYLYIRLPRGGDAEDTIAQIHMISTLMANDVDDVDLTKDQLDAQREVMHPIVGTGNSPLLLAFFEGMPRRASFAELFGVDQFLIKNADSRIKKAWLLYLAETPACEIGTRDALTALEDPRTLGDRILLDAATCAAARNDLGFLKLTVKREKLPQAPAFDETVSRVAEHYARGVPKDSIGGLIVELASAKSNASSAIVEGLARGWPKNQPLVLDDATETAIVVLLQKLPNSAKGRLVSLAERLGSRKMVEYGREITASLLAQAADAAQPEVARLDAAKQAVEFRKTDEAVVAALLNLITPRTSPELARGTLAALSASEVPSLGESVVGQLGAMTPAARQEAVRLLLSREAWTPALLAALDGGVLQLGELSLDQKQALATHPNRQLQNRAKALLARGGGLPNPDRQKVLDELQPIAAAKGDAAAGKLVFAKQCAKCHMHSGEGQKIGPDLTGMAVHPKREILVQLIDPNRSVEGNFRVYSVETDDGRTLTGLLASETKTSVELIDAEGKRHQLQRDEIEALVASTKSLMPDGFEKQVSRDDLTNLLEFLTTRGKFFPLDLRKGATIVSTRGMFHAESSEVERLVFADWSPKTFAGVPFTLVDPQGDRVPNVILLNSTSGTLPGRMPHSVKLPCNSPAKAIHLLSGVSGWGFPLGEKGSVSMIVRLHYADGTTEDHPLRNGEHFADYIRRVDVPGSQFAFALRGQQVRYLAITPQRREVIREVEFLKGPDRTAPVVMAATVETP